MQADGSLHPALPNHINAMSNTPRTRFRGWTACEALALAPLLLCAAFGQAANPQPTAAPSAPSVPTPAQVASGAPGDSKGSYDQDTTYKLSPFVVSANQETGYLATSTLAGTRLNTPLKDLGASISVYTKDFISDVNAANLDELLVYATGMDVAGSQGNFSDSTGGDIGTTEPTSEAARENPQSASRTRGLAAPNFTRDYFLTDITADTYNVEDVTVNRGPNSMLFGVGSPAGVVDTGLLKAKLGGDHDEATFRYGNNGANRWVLDMNRVIVPDKLAFRIAALDDDEQYDQRPANQQQKRLYATVTAEPFSSTLIRVNVETGNIDANRPMAVLPLDSISSYWLAAGRPTYNWLAYATTPNRTTLTGPFIGQAGIFTGIVYTYPVGALYPTMAFPATISSGTGSYAYRANLPDPSFGGQALAAGSILWTETLNIGEIPASFWPGGVKPAGLKYQGFTDYSVFPFNKEQIDQTGQQGESFHTYTIHLEQRALHDHVGMEAVYYFQRDDQRSVDSYSTFGPNDQVRIDTNVTLPDGQPNPNVGRPYMASGQNAWTHDFVERDAIRGTAYAKYDFSELSPTLGEWFGSHTLTGMVERNADDIVNYNTYAIDYGQYPNVVNTNPAAFSRIPYFVSYIGNSVLNGAPIQLVPTHAVVAPGITSPITYYYDPNGANNVGSFTTSPSSIEQIVSSGSANREVIDSQAAVLQSYWASNLIVTTLGIRRDTDFAVSYPISYAANPDKDVYGFGDFNFPSKPPELDAETVRSGSAVVNWPQQWVKLPLGVDLSVFVNEAQNFTPSGVRDNPYDQQIPAPEGKTKEIGLNLSFLDGRFTIRYDHFNTQVQNQTYTNSAYTIAVENGTYQLARNWYNDMNVNPQNAQYVQQDINTLMSALPANFEQLWGWNLTGSAASQTLTLNYTVLPNLTDTTSFVAQGNEVDLVFNPTRNWRVLLNFAQQNVVESDIAPNFRQFVSVMGPIWNELGNRAFTGVGGTYPVGYVWGSTLPATTTTVAQWALANVYVPLATIEAEEGISSAEIRKDRINLVANYTFSPDTWFRGWSLGGGLRWQSKMAIGYPMGYNPNGSVWVSIANPYYAPPLINGDAWIGYTHPLWHNRIVWKVQLDAKNIIGSTQPIPITAQPWGQVATVRLPPERRWYLTNSFDY